MHCEERDRLKEQLAKATHRSVMEQSRTDTAAAGNDVAAFTAQEKISESASIDHQQALRKYTDHINSHHCGQD